jgi:NAD(P)-dependent dehydrogenase (short-subunit alcohol dehydrogenase family)
MMPCMTSLREGYRALVIGASGGIGQAFVTALRQDPRCGEVLAVSRGQPTDWDLREEASLAELAQHISPLLARGERVIWAKLSARVGSIQDNHKGGWYGYRAAKAALNQLLQTSAIELARQRPLAVVAALQPGTVRSALSEPFVGDDAMAPGPAVAGMLQALDQTVATGRAVFLDYRGATVVW